MSQSLQPLSRVQLILTSWTAARQASLSITNSQSLFKLMSIKSLMPSNHLIICHSLLFLPSIFPSIRVFSNESGLCIRWPDKSSGKIDGEKAEIVTDFIFLGSKMTTHGDCSHKIETHLLLRRKAMTNLDNILKKQRHYFADKGPYTQSYGFSISHVWM